MTIWDFIYFLFFIDFFYLVILINFIFSSLFIKIKIFLFVLLNKI